MAKLYFLYSAMNAGKTTTLLQSAHNYHEHGMKTFLLTAAIDTRAGKGMIASRIGLEAKAETFTDRDNLLLMLEQQVEKIACVFVDEAQFLTEQQAWQLSEIVDKLSIPVMCYGLRTDFKGNLFPGSASLLALADIIKEIKTICWCSKKATMVLRIDPEGQVLNDGDQIEIGGNDRYVSLCRHHWKNKAVHSSVV
jgi:thymidine kinase